MILEPTGDPVKKYKRATAVTPPPRSAEAEAEPGRPGARLGRRILIAAGWIGLLTLCLLLWLARPSPGYDPKHRHPDMPDYAAKFLMDYLKANDLVRDSKDSQPLTQTEIRDRELHEDIAATMPPGRRNKFLLIQAARYFDGNVFDVWTNCRSASELSNPVATTRTDILWNLVQTMKAVGLSQCDKGLIKQFVVMYESLKEGGMSREGLIAELSSRMIDHGDFSQPPSGSQPSGSAPSSEPAVK